MLYAKKKRKLKLNKLNKISGLSRWEAKATERMSVSIRWGCGGGDGGPPGHQCVVRACGQRQEAEVRGGTPRQSRSSASLRYFFGAVPSAVVHAGRAGLRLLAERSCFLLQAAPAGLVQPHVAQHGLGQTRVGETGPLYEQRLRHVRHEAWRDARGGRWRFVFLLQNHKRHLNFTEIPTYLNFPNRVGLSVAKRADFKFVLLLDIT